jgi:hypothetical protein
MPVLLLESKHFLRRLVVFIHDETHSVAPGCTAISTPLLGQDLGSAVRDSDVPTDPDS